MSRENGRAGNHQLNFNGYILKPLSMPGHGDGGHHVGSQIDTEDGDSSKREGHISQDEQQERRDLGNVGGQSVGNGFLQVVKDQATLFNASYDGGKVVVQQDHVSGLLGHIGSRDTMATPISAFFKAGESFTPSPVTATMAPIL
ncbi:hypothetical protein TCAL_15854 [Tigriopus californicus]|uniref:Uncharacterized protein n=1 Tax=Tigriopus californicus TaxID=6832 RepID=A0A553NR06_TIGCA|nr:hypothetical protein TCAL_15854 [Tigriopus californicus]